MDLPLFDKSDTQRMILMKASDGGGGGGAGPEADKAMYRQRSSKETWRLATGRGGPHPLLTPHTRQPSVNKSTNTEGT